MNKQKVKEYIQKEIPEIMELKFGCLVSKKDLRYTKKIEMIGIIVDKSYTNENWIVKFSENKDVSFCEKSDLKSIGRPITLSDVLRVTKEKFKEDNLSFVNYAGVEEILELWNLKENYDNQSEEVYNLLAEILL